MLNETSKEAKVVCLVNPTQELATKPVEVQNAIAQTSQMLPIANMLPILLTRRTRGIKPLLDYSESHVVTSYQYLGILH
jgi:hypothetical protein